MRYVLSLFMCVISVETYAAARAEALRLQVEQAKKELTAVRADHALEQQRAATLQANLGAVDAAIRGAFPALRQPEPDARRSTTDVLTDLIGHVTAAAAGGVVYPVLVAQVDTLLGALGIAPAEPLGLQEKLGLVQRKWAGLSADLALAQEALQRLQATATGLADENAAAVNVFGGFLSPVAGRASLVAYAQKAQGKLQDAVAGLSATEDALHAKEAELQAMKQEAALFSAQKQRIRDAARQASAEKSQRLAEMEARMAALEARLAAAQAAEAEAERLAATAVADKDAAGAAAAGQVTALQQDLVATRKQAAEAQRLAAAAQATARQADAEARSAVERENAIATTLAQVQLKAAQTPALKGRIAQLQDKLDQREAHIATLQAQYDSQTRDLEAAKAALTAAQAEAAANGASAQAAASEAASRIAALTADVATKDAECTRLATALAAAIADHAAQQEVLNTQLRTVRAQMEDMERGLSSARRGRASAEAEVETLRDQVAARAAEVEALKVAKAASDAGLEQVRVALAAAAQEAETNTRKIADLENALQTMPEGHARAIAELKDADAAAKAEMAAGHAAEKAVSETALAEMREKAVKDVAEINRLASEIATKEAENTALQEKLRKAEVSHAAVEKELASEKKTHGLTQEGLAKIKAEMQQVLASHDEALAKKNAEIQAQVSAVKRQLEADNAEYVRKLEEACQVKLTGAERLYNKKAADLDVSKNAELQRLKGAHEQNIKSIRINHQEALEQLRTAMDKNLRELTEKHQKELADAKERQTTLAAENLVLQALKDQSDRLLADMQREMPRAIKKNTELEEAKHKRAIDDLRAAHGLAMDAASTDAVAEKAKYEEAIAAQEMRHRQAMEEMTAEARSFRQFIEEAHKELKNSQDGAEKIRRAHKTLVFANYALQRDKNLRESQLRDLEGAKTQLAGQLETERGVTRQLQFDLEAAKGLSAAQEKSLQQEQDKIKLLEAELKSFQEALGCIKAMLITQKRTDGVFCDPEDGESVAQEARKADQLLEDTADATTDYSTLTPQVVFAEVLNYYEALVREAKAALPVYVGEDLQKSLAHALAMDSGVEEGEAIHAERREGHDSSNLEGKKPIVSLLNDLDAALLMDGGGSVGDGSTEGDSSVYMYGISRGTSDTLEDHPISARFFPTKPAQGLVKSSLEDASDDAAMGGGALVSHSKDCKPFGSLSISRSPDENMRT